MKKTAAIIIIGLAALLPGGCRRESPYVAEGVLYSVEYMLEDGRTGGFTRINNAGSVPGHNGSWNVDAYGRLTKDYLIVTYPKNKNLRQRIIPAARLISIQFGDGGIKHTDAADKKPTALE